MLSGDGRRLGGAPALGTPRHSEAELPAGVSAAGDCSSAEVPAAGRE